MEGFSPLKGLEIVAPANFTPAAVAVAAAVIVGKMDFSLLGFLVVSVLVLVGMSE